MTEQVRVDDVITSIMCGIMTITDECEYLNNARAVLYMHLSGLQIYKEETALSTQVDNSTDLIQMYLASMLVRGCTKGSVRAYGHELKKMMQAIDKPLIDITRQDINKYMAYCKLVCKNRDTTINNKKRAIRGLYQWMMEEAYISQNPMMGIRDSKTEKKVKEVFEDEQIIIIKDVAARHSLLAIAIVDFLHRTGVRISEMVELNRDDVDLQGRCCIVYGKGRKERPVYLNGEAAVHLKEYLDSRKDNNPALFVTQTPKHTRIGKQAARNLLKELTFLDTRISGIQINPHKWRRQFVTDLLEKDVPLELVADLVGHANLNTTKDNYANYSKSKAKDAHKKYLN